MGILGGILKFIVIMILIFAIFSILNLPTITKVILTFLKGMGVNLG